MIPEGQAFSGLPVVFLDIESDSEAKRVLDIGAVRSDGAVYHSAGKKNFWDFANGARVLCGHNIVAHDLVLLSPPQGAPLRLEADTPRLSALPFPQRRFHALMKGEKILSETLNDPVGDSKKARDLLLEESAAFGELPRPFKQILF